MGKSKSEFEQVGGQGEKDWLKQKRADKPWSWPHISPTAKHFSPCLQFEIYLPELIMAICFNLLAVGSVFSQQVQTLSAFAFITV